MGGVRVVDDGMRAGTIGMRARCGWAINPKVSEMGQAIGSGGEASEGHGGLGDEP